MIETPRPTDNSQAAPAEARRYRIDREWFPRHDLSFAAVVRGRMDEACRAKLGMEVTERLPQFDQTTGKMRMEERRTTFGEDPVRVIREHCGKARSYITRDMPTLEAVFRILLARSNEPMTLEQVREELAEWCPGGGCQWLLLPPETLERLVRNDTSYGLRAVE